MKRHLKLIRVLGVLQLVFDQRGHLFIIVSLSIMRGIGIDNQNILRRAKRTGGYHKK